MQLLLLAVIVIADRGLVQAAGSLAILGLVIAPHSPQLVSPTIPLRSSARASSTMIAAAIVLVWRSSQPRAS